MKAPKFHVGQAVVSLKSNWPRTYNGGNPLPSKYPVANRVYEVIGLHEGHDALWYLILDGIEPGNAFNERYFAPAEYLSDEALAQLLEETLEPVTA